MLKKSLHGHFGAFRGFVSFTLLPYREFLFDTSCSEQDFGGQLLAQLIRGAVVPQLRP